MLRMWANSLYNRHLSHGVMVDPHTMSNPKTWPPNTVSDLFCPPLPPHHPKMMEAMTQV